MPSERPNADAISVAEYLAFEDAAAGRHEYVRGEIYATTGTTARHNLVVRNIVGVFSAAERGGPCRTYMLDIRVRAADDVYYYPDIVVTCVAHDASTLMISEPCVVVEVASQSTRHADRGEKLAAYKDIDSLRAYLVVEQHRKQITLYARADAAAWTRVDIVNSGSLTIPCLNTTLALDQIYDGVELPPLRIGEPSPVGSEGLVFEMDPL